MSPLLTILLFFVVALIARECNVVIAQLSPLPGFPIETNSEVVGSLQCTKNSDEIYAVCGSQDSSGAHTAAVKYNLQPFSFAARRLTSGSIFTSCDLYETTLQSTSRVVCATQQTTSTILFLRVSDMKVSAQVPIAASYFVVVDTPNQVAYVSNYNIPSTIYKIIGIASSSPRVAGNITWGENSADNTPCALLIVGDFLYAHLSMYPSGLARIRISNLTHDRTVMFAFGEDFGQADNLANDNNFIYDLTSGLFEQNGMLVRITYQNNSFARFDSLNTGYSLTYSLTISPDLQTLFIAAQDQSAIILVSTTSFNTIAMTAPVIPSAIGRPIVMTNGIFYAFSGTDDKVWGFSNCYRQANATFGGPSKIICPAGYFCLDPNATSPTPCGPGKFTPSEGWCSCLLCQEGFMCLSNTTVNPEPCPSGFYCPSTISSSIPCPCGAFCPSETTLPSPCQQGTFNPNIGSASNTSCESCSAEEYCPVASCSPASCSCGMHCAVASRTNCTPGYYNSDPSFFCSLCPEGFFCPSETTCVPIPCAENQFCPPGSSEPSNTVLLQLPNSPISTDSGVVGSMQCTESSDESYAVCGSNFGGAIKYNLQPFSFAVRSGQFGAINSMSCDLYETSFQSASRVACALQTPAAILFLQVSDLTQAASVSLPNAYFVAVDTPNQVAYVSNFNIPATIYKIVNIASSSPILVGNVTWGQNSGDQHPAALLVIGEYLYNHLAMNPARLARIRISNLSHDKTLEFIGNEGGGSNDNLANDMNFIYDLTQFGKVVRCTYQNNNFARFDSLSTDFTATNALSISPDRKTLFFTAWGQNTIVLVDVATFTQTVSTGPSVPSAAGRPIVMSNGIFYAFSLGNDQVYGFKYCLLSASFNGSSKIPCPAGYFCPNPNATAPTPCSPGTYSPSTGFCFCPFCPPGAFCSSASTITPQSCPVGTYNENNGASSIAACVPCPLGKICQEGSITPIDCNQQNCDSTRNCTLYSKILVGVTDAQPYCVVSNRSSCTSPLTCSSINLPAYDIPLQCEAAGCSYSGGSCVNRNDCFNLFLPSFVIQPLGLMFIGFAKDVVVLLLIGIFGDIFMRKVKTMMLPFNFWKNKWNKDKIKLSMKTTIFANDANCRNESSTKQESFEEYCERVAIALFELPETDDDEVRTDWKRKLVDAITFSMFDFGLWFELDEIEEQNNDNNEQEESNQRDEEVNEQDESETIEQQPNTSKKALSAKDEESEPRKDENDDVETEKDEPNEVVNDEKQPDEKNEEEKQDEKNQNEERRLQQNQENGTSGNLKCDEEETTIQESQKNEKLILSSESFTTTSALQQLVNAHMFSNAQCVVYFASSRDWKLRAASALNNFPSSLQLFYYISSVIIFVAFTFRDVVLDSYNQNIIGQVSNFTCGNAEKHSQSKTTYLLLGFRFLNSSSTATVILIFIKTLHAIYSSSSERFEKLQLPQRLPILGLLTSKSTQILLVFYFLVVASFALAGVTYGIRIIPCVVVVVIAAVLLILDSAILKFVRDFISKRKARQDAHRDKVLEQVATQELPFLGLNADERNEREVLTAGSRRSLYTEDDPLVEHEEFDFITVDEAFEAAKQSVLNPAPTVSLPQALLVFLLREEIPTIILTITLQLCFNYICLLEFGEAFGVADQWQLPNTEYEARKFNCIWGMFESDVSSKISVLTSFVGFL